MDAYFLFYFLFYLQVSKDNVYCMIFLKCNLNRGFKPANCYVSPKLHCLSSATASALNICAWDSICSVMLHTISVHCMSQRNIVSMVTIFEVTVVILFLNSICEFLGIRSLLPSSDNGTTKTPPTTSRWSRYVSEQSKGGSTPENTQ